MKKNAFRYLMTYLTAILTAVLNFAYTPQVKADEVLYEHTFNVTNDSKGVGSYTSEFENTCTNTNGSNIIVLTNFNNNSHNQGWVWVRCGSKSGTSIATITTKNAIAETVTKIVVTIATKTEWKSLDLTKVTTTLTVGGDADFTGSTPTSVTLTEGDVEIPISTPTTNQYYKLTFDCQKSSTNGFVQVNKVTFYKSSAQSGQHTLHLNLNGVDVSELSSFWSNGVTKTDSIFNDNSTTPITLPDISSARNGYTGHWETASQATPTTGDGNTITSVTPGTEDIYVVAVWTRKSVIVDLSSIAALLQSVKVGNNAAITTGFNNISMTPDDVIIITTKPSVAGKFVALTADKPITLNVDGTYTFTFTGSISLTATEYNATDFYALKYQAAAGVLTTSGSIDLTGKTLVVLDGKKLCLQDNSAGLVVDLGTAASDVMLRKTLTAGTVTGTFAKVGDYVHLTQATATGLAGTDVTPTLVTTIDPLYTEGSFVQVSGTIANWKVGTYPLFATTGFGMKQLEAPESTDNFDVTGALYNYNGTLEVLVSSAADFHTAVPAGAPTLTSNANKVNQVTITPADKCHAFYAVVAKDAAQPVADAYTEITEATTEAISADADVWTYGVRDFYTNSTAVKTAYQYKTAQSFTITVSELGVTRAVACKENENILDKVGTPGTAPFGLTFEYYTTDNTLATDAKIGATDKPSDAMTIYAVYSTLDATQEETVFKQITTTAELEDGSMILIVDKANNECFDGSATSNFGKPGIPIVINADGNIYAGANTSLAHLEAISLTLNAISGGYTLKTASGYYIGAQAAKKILGDQNTQYVNGITFDNNGNALIAGESGSGTLQHNTSNTDVFNYYTSNQKPIQIFVATEMAKQTYTLGDVHTLSYTDAKLSVSIDGDDVLSGSLVQANVLVDVDVTPESGEQVDKLTVNGTEVAFDEKNDCYSFPMPAADATIAVTYKSATPTAVEDVDAPDAVATVKKVFINGKVYIVRDGIYYDMNGVRIN